MRQKKGKYHEKIQHNQQQGAAAIQVCDGCEQARPLGLEQDPLLEEKPKTKTWKQRTRRPQAGERDQVAAGFGLN